VIPSRQKRGGGEDGINHHPALPGSSRIIEVGALEAQPHLLLPLREVLMDGNPDAMMETAWMRV
jgi:hypothetical protein